MTDLKKLSEEMAEKYADRIRHTLESADARARSFKAGFNSCLDLLAKQSGEYQKAWHIKWKERIPSDSITFFEPDPNAKWEYTEKITKYIEYNALLAANAKIAQLEEELLSSKANAQILDEMYNICCKDRISLEKDKLELQQRLKELEILLSSKAPKAISDMVEKIKELEQELEVKKNTNGTQLDVINELCTEKRELQTKLTTLEAKLQEAEKVIEKISKVEEIANLKLGAWYDCKVINPIKKEARTYLQNKGGDDNE